MAIVIFQANSAKAVNSLIDAVISIFIPDNDSMLIDLVSIWKESIRWF